MANKTAELRALSDEELASRLLEKKDDLFKFRFRLATGQLDNISVINNTRKEVARIETLIREREIALHEGKA
jgi:large subunit ribosomal protein L29